MDSDSNLIMEEDTMIQQPTGEFPNMNDPNCHAVEDDEEEDLDNIL